MVALSDVNASNGRISTAIPQGLVAVFVGGTSGVGEYTLKALAKHSPTLRAYIVGRSQESADRILNECKEIAPSAQIHFIQADVSLLKVVDDVCRQIREKETAINILVTSQGTMAFSKSSSRRTLSCSLRVSSTHLERILTKY
jgi:short-subunit dehydrogenase